MSQLHRNQPPKTNSPLSARLVVAVIYFFMLAVYLVAAFAPAARVWGFDWWGYYPILVQVALVFIGVTTGIGVMKWSGGISSEEEESPKLGEWLSVVIGAVMVAGFVMLPSATHITGDGYQVLGMLSHDVKSAKIWDMGADIVNRAFYAVVSGEPQQRALTAFRVESAVAGVVFLVGLVVISKRLFSDNIRRLLFVTGVATGGYMLLFFGYVENYSFLITSLLLFCLAGLLVANDRLSVWWLLLFLVPAISLHIFAVAILPGFLYLAVCKARWSGQLWKRYRKQGLLYSAALVVVGCVAYYLLRRYSLFFTFAFLPLVPDRFTVDNDWLLSPKHIVDLINLLLLLSPSLPLFLGGLLLWRNTLGAMNVEKTFLAVVTVCTVATVFLFNPGIGMPRNWDLFAIAGPSLVIATYRFFLRHDHNRRMAAFLAGLGIALSVLSLGPRVVAHATPELGIAHFRNYLELDPVRTRVARRFLVDYYKSIGDSTMTKMERDRSMTEYPEINFGRKGQKLMAQGRFQEAEAYLRRALEINPIYYDAYCNLGICELQIGSCDSARALMEIANGINPLNVQTIQGLGAVALKSNDYVSAEKHFREALRLDSTYVRPMAGMISVLIHTKRYGESEGLLNRLASDTTLPMEYFRQVGDSLSANGASSEAMLAYRIAVSKGMDSSYTTKMGESVSHSKQ